MYGLVLEGGGAKGSYQIGACKAIREEGLAIGAIAGTSVGALNGALLVQGDYEKAYELWRNISYSQVIDADEARIEEFKSGDISLRELSKELGELISTGGVDAGPLRQLIKELLDENKMRQSDIDFGMVTISLTDLKPLEVFLEDIPEGKVGEYLLASAYFPAFKTEKIDGKYYLDGGLYNNLPVDLLKNRGYKDLIQIRTFGIGHVKKVDTGGLNITSIEPREDLGGTLEFESERARYNLELGYYDGLKALRGLKGNRYYIETDLGLSDISNYIWELDDHKVSMLRETFNVRQGMDDRRAIFEEIIPTVSKMVGGNRDSNYEDIFYLLIDRLADYYEIYKFRIYKLEELLDIIKGKVEEELKEEPSLIDALAHKVDLLSLFNKDEILKELAFILF